MPVDDPSDLNVGDRQLRKRVERLEAGTGGGDSTHPGAGGDSILLGTDGLADGYASVAIGFEAKASPITDTDADEAVAVGTASTADGFGAIALGGRSYAQYENAMALGWLAFSGHAFSTAIGHQAVTSATHQIMLGRAEDTVRVPGNLTVVGTFSNPSARHLKCDIVPAPRLVSVFPEVFEWEYIEGDGRRHIGPMADDLVGTDAERFLVVDDAGEPAGIDKLGLHTAQIAALLARIERLEEELRRRDG
jgi:hypothetical protein